MARLGSEKGRSKFTFTCAHSYKHLQLWCWLSHGAQIIAAPAMIALDFASTDEGAFEKYQKQLNSGGQAAGWHRNGAAC